MTITAATLILGTGTVSAEAINAFFADRGPDYAPSYAPDKTYKPSPPTLGQDIIAVSQAWGINHDVMAAQIMHESAAWQSRIVRDKNNPSGLGAVDNNAYDGAVTFLTPFDGVRATAAHLMTYASGRGDWTQYDPRAAFVPESNVGSCKTWGSLGGKWATDSGYGGRVVALANRLMTFANDHTWEPPMVQAQIPGFTWLPADSDHYDRGRRESIRGGAQHYTAGTDSLAWLRSTSTPPVSVHFLVKHNPTLEDRGWQLVKIEDTAWTTAFANPYTVAIEYEHKQGQSIPDTAYEVLARTWADIAWYIGEHQLGDFHSGVLGHKEWVNNPSLICPDGIDVIRIETRRREIMTAPLPPPADWPRVPTSEKDPWAKDNPYDKTLWIPRVFVDKIMADRFSNSGYVLEEAFAETGADGVVRVVQYFERARWELAESGTITKGLVGRESLWFRYPERIPT